MPKWEAFWAGHRARSRCESSEAYPFPPLTQEEKARGKKTSYFRGAWLFGWGADGWKKRVKATAYMREFG